LNHIKEFPLDIAIQHGQKLRFMGNKIILAGNNQIKEESSLESWKLMNLQPQSSKSFNTLTPNL
jgi:hypothetical protein